MNGKSKVRYIWFLISPYWKHGKLYMVIAILMAALFQPISAVLSTLLPQRAIDGVVQGQSTEQIITVVALFTLFIAIINVLQSTISKVYTQLAQTKINYKIIREVNEKALHTDYKYYDNPEFYNEFSYAQQNYSSNAGQAASIVPQLIQAVVTALAMGTIIAQAGAVLLVVVLVYVLLQTLLTLPQTKINADFSVTSNDLKRPISYIYRTVLQKESAAEMRSSAAGEKLLGTFTTVMNSYIFEFRKYLRKLLKFSIPQSLISTVQGSIILLFIVIFVIDGDTSKIGLYASLTLAAGILSSNISSVFGIITQLYQLTLYGERIARFFETESVIEPRNSDASAAPKGQYCVEFNDVSFEYEESTFGVQSLNLKIPAGGRIAIIGENGAGKSTIMKLLLRLFDVDGGSIRINGQDLRDYDIHSLRRKIGVAYQDVRILSMSLRDVLTAYNDVSDEKLADIMKKLGLHKVLDRIDGNFDTMVSREFTEDGVVLSGGEAQRIALARLFTGSFGLLLLDEPNSALDPISEHKLMNLILDKANTATTIMVAHRLSIVRDFDVIYHMEHGKIIECGSHDELMDARGKYYDMFTRQAENYQYENVS